MPVHERTTVEVTVKLGGILTFLLSQSLGKTTFFALRQQSIGQRIFRYLNKNISNIVA